MSASKSPLYHPQKGASTSLWGIVRSVTISTESPGDHVVGGCGTSPLPARGLLTSHELRPISESQIQLKEFPTCRGNYAVSSGGGWDMCHMSQSSWGETHLE